MNEINKANFLVLILTDEMKTANKESQTTIEKNSLIKFLNCFDKDNNPYLPAFTDWNEIHFMVTTKK